MIFAIFSIAFLLTSIYLTVFKDKNTPSPFVEAFPEDDGEAARAALPDHIYMDAMGFGMGNCCLQVKCLFLPETWPLLPLTDFHWGYLSQVTLDQCCLPLSLQVTFQACSISEARYLYDQLATFCPIVVRTHCLEEFLQQNMLSMWKGSKKKKVNFASQNKWQWITVCLYC